MESEATPAVEANFRPPETRGNFNVETPADSGVMDINSQEYAEYKSQVETADQVRLAEVRADLAEFLGLSKTDTENRQRYDTWHSLGAGETYSMRAARHNRESAKAVDNYEVVTIGGKDYFVEYVPNGHFNNKKSLFGRAYGLGTGNHTQVREDLPPRVRNFVKAHELYHLQDTKSKNKVSAEIRAIIFPMLKDPVGFLTAAAYNIIDDFNNIRAKHSKNT